MSDIKDYKWDTSKYIRLPFKGEKTRIVADIKLLRDALKEIEAAAKPYTGPMPIIVVNAARTALDVTKEYDSV